MSKFSIELVNKLKPILCTNYSSLSATNQLIIRNFSDRKFKNDLLKTNQRKLKLNTNVCLESYGTIYEQRRAVAQWGLFGFFGKSKPVEEELILTTFGEPSLKILGLASNYTPVGWIQSILELIHADLGLPWYGTIIVYTILLRIALIPLYILKQRFNAQMHIDMLQSNELTLYIIEHRKATGNKVEFNKVKYEVNGPIRFVCVSLERWNLAAQSASTLATFLAIHGMCNLPVESMFNGGVLWFENLALMDFYFGLPILSCVTLSVFLKRKIDLYFSNLYLTLPSFNSKLSSTLKYAFILPIGLFPFVCFLPSGVMLYICTTSFCTLIIPEVFQIEKVKRFCRIPIITPAMEKQLAEKINLDFVKGFKESNRNSNYTMQNFDKNGIGAPLKTFKKNPKENKKKK